jgi:hypothetical protein
MNAFVHQGLGEVRLVPGGPGRPGGPAAPARLPCTLRVGLRGARRRQRGVPSHPRADATGDEGRGNGEAAPARVTGAPLFLRGLALPAGC